MRLVSTLLSYLSRRFDRDPLAALALRIRYEGVSMSWAVTDGVLTTAVSGGSGVTLSVDLSAHTIASLAAFIAAQTGYSVPYIDESISLGALALVDGEGDQDSSNGDHLYVYRSLTWAVLSPIAQELTLARAQIAQMIMQMVAQTASAEWLDEIGSYFNVRRKQSETDAIYAPRIVAEVVRPMANNKAMELAIRAATGCPTAAVVDAEMQTQAGVDTFGLFDVSGHMDANSTINFEFFGDAALNIVNSTRDAGTHVRDIQFSISASGAIYTGAVTMVGETVAIYPAS